MGEAWLGLSVRSLWISELSIGQKMMISCPPEFALKDWFRPNLAEFTRASLTAGASLSSFSVRHRSAMKSWGEVQRYQMVPKIRGLVLKKTTNKAAWKVFKRTWFKLIHTLLPTGVRGNQSKALPSGTRETIKLEKFLLHRLPSLLHSRTEDMSCKMVSIPETLHAALSHPFLWNGS